ncbi:MAG TPA: hypothetical protein VER03_08735 [Bryobacteraceae bacterium]|nr:hypothetical protein [Bryobacteraceae bacterium]
MTSQSALRHIPEETLEQYSMGQLPESEIEPVEEHLLFCEKCQNVFEATDEFVRVARTGLDRLQSEPQPQPWWTRLWQQVITNPKPALALATCALALFVIFPRQNAIPASVDLQTMRGPESAVVAPANRDLALRLALPEGQAAGTLSVRLADSGGAIVRQTEAVAKGGVAVANVERLSPGTYWARLYAGDELIREYALNVQ